MNGDQVSQNMTTESSPVRGNHVHIPFNNGPRDKIQKYLSFPDVTEYKDIKSLLDFQGFKNGLASLHLP